MSCLRNVAPRSAGFLPVLVLLLLSTATMALAQDADHLLITEVFAKSHPSVDGSPFIEVTNPTADPVDLTEVYLSTAHDNTLGQLYWNVVTGADAGGGTSGNVHGHFPAGMMLAAGESLVISLAGSDEFEEQYGFLPHLEWFEDGNSPDQIPEMVEALTGSINAGLGGGANVPQLGHDTFDSIILYQWDGVSDLVADIDYVFYGTDNRVRADKSGLTVGVSTYLDDTAYAAQRSLAVPGTGYSLYRDDLMESDETATDGNGVTGHDETSEDLTTGWTRATPSNPAEPTEWYAPAPIVLSATNSVAVEGYAVTLVTEIVAYDDVSDVVVNYRTDGGDWITMAPTAGDDNRWTAEIPAQPVDTLVEWYLTCEGAGGGEAVYPVEGTRMPLSYQVQSLADGVAKLLITEINTGKNIYPYDGMHLIAPEFIELHNPNDFDVDLSDYYLTDAINYLYSTQVYWQITDGPPHSQPIVGGGHYNDFTARFPDGATMTPGQTIVVSMASSGWFEGVYGTLPDYEMYPDDRTVEGVPAMRPVFTNPPDDLPGNSIFTADRPYGGSSDELPKGIPEMEEHYGEPLVLYHWVEGDALVTDIDCFVWGEGRSGDYRYGFQKTEDDGYFTDTSVNDQDWYQDLDETGNLSYSRLDEEEGDQNPDFGNGVLGRDETSENWQDTFDTIVPTPGVFLAGLPRGNSLSLAVPAKTFLPKMGETFRISFTTTDNTETKLRIIDLEGRLVASLWDSRFDGAVSEFPEYPSTVNWDGRNDIFEQVRAGMYVVHLQAVDNVTGEKSVKTVPVVIATRLK